MKLHLVQRMCEMTCSMFAASVCAHHVSFTSSKINSVFWIILADHNLPLLVKRRHYALGIAQLQVSAFSLPLCWWKWCLVILKNNIQATYSDYRVDHMLIIALYASLFVSRNILRESKGHLLNNICFYSRFSSLSFLLYSESTGMGHRASCT